MVIVGIDEVGRGPLAGPVSIGVVISNEKIYKKLKKDRRLPKRGVDSKKLKKEEREKYSEILKELSKENKIFYSIVHISNKVIDKKGISFAIKDAINKGVKNLKINPKNSQILLDGGLFAPSIFKRQKTIIRGDEKEKIISWASILAKVSRDRLMAKMSIKFPKYGFEKHSGYGTVNHRSNILKNGLSDIHRSTFCKNLIFSTI